VGGNPKWQFRVPIYFEKEDVQIDVQNGRVTIMAESKITEEHDEAGYAVRKRRYSIPCTSVKKE
jgi:hypothetical protein